MFNIRIKEKTGQARYLVGYTKPEYIRPCYSCGGCNTVCPVNTATGRLSPLKLVHMANLGFIDQLVSMPDIWYCMSCGRCSNLCPMMVQTKNLIQSLRAEAIIRKIVRPELSEQHRNVLKGLISALWHAARSLLDGESPNATELWEEWVQTPPSRATRPIKLPSDIKKNASFLETVQTYGVNKTSLNSCFTCRECSSSCPICLDTSIFDPLLIVRSTNMALKDELLHSPSIWLCIDCQSCILACSQCVKVALLIRQLQHIACTEGFVPKDFPLKWMQLKNEVYAQYIRKIDILLSQDEPI